MRTVIQRVSEASVMIDGHVHGDIGRGYMILVGFEDADTEEIVRAMCAKISRLRIFDDDAGKMNRSILDVQGAILSISQFTLYADCRKGNRPSFSGSGSPVHAEALYHYFNDQLRYLTIPVEEGIFGADMKVRLLNDGPVTIVLDSKEIVHG